MNAPRTTKAVLAALAAGVVVLTVGCGDDSADSSQLSPEQVQENLADHGYQVGDVLTKGAPEGVINGRDADAYLSIDYSPDGDRLYASVYFFGSEKLAEALWRRFSRGDDTAVELRGTRVYHVAGTQEQLIALVAAAEE